MRACYRVLVPTELHHYFHPAPENPDLGILPVLVWVWEFLTRAGQDKAGGLFRSLCAIILLLPGEGGGGSQCTFKFQRIGALNRQQNHHTPAITQLSGCAACIVAGAKKDIGTLCAFDR